MKRILPPIFLLFLSISLFAQAPADYYNGTETLRGKALKHALYEIIKGHTEYPYTSSSTDVWDILKETDKDTINPDNVILFYTGWSVNAAQEYNNGAGWSREHVWAKSRGDFGTTPPAGTDVNNLRPLDISVNSARSNRYFDMGSTEYFDNGVPTGCYTSATEWVWEPRKEVKGDVARIIFYMATRYEGENGEPDLYLVDYIPDQYTKEPIFGKLSTLMKWNEEDPVDDYERHRNDVIYSYQHNRNPFIDHSEFVNMIWGADSITTGTVSFDKRSITVYPNPVKDLLYFKNAVDLQKEIYSMNGVLVRKTSSSSINLNSLSRGLYIVIFKDKDGKILKITKISRS